MLVATPVGSPAVVPLAIPLTRAGSSRPARFEPSGSHHPESARERIHPVLLLGDLLRFEGMSLIELAPEDEFGACFFKGYYDLKRKVALAHSEWGVSTFPGVNSDYWDAEVLV